MGIVGHGVDGEIPAGQVFPEAFFKVHPVRTPVIPVSPFGAKGGDLNGLPAGHNGDGAVLLSGADQGKVLKHLGNLPWQGVGTQVPVVGGQPQQPVPHTAAHGPGFKAPVLQPFHQIQNRNRYRKLQETHPPAASPSLSAIMAQNMGKVKISLEIVLGNMAYLKRPAAKRNESELVSLLQPVWRYGLRTRGLPVLECGQRLPG